MGAADGEIASAFRLEVLCTSVWEPNTTFTSFHQKRPPAGRAWDGLFV